MQLLVKTEQDTFSGDAWTHSQIRFNNQSDGFLMVFKYRDEALSHLHDFP